MPELLTMQDLANGHLDVKALGEAANGDENTIVTTRTGNTYPSAERAINIMFQNGGLPAAPFATKALMIASALVNGKYAQVTDDTVNNGLYLKTAGAWVKSAYDPTLQAKEYTDELKVFISGEQPIADATPIPFYLNIDMGWLRNPLYTGLIIKVDPNSSMSVTANSENDAKVCPIPFGNPEDYGATTPTFPLLTIIPKGTTQVVAAAGNSYFWVADKDGTKNERPISFLKNDFNVLTNFDVSDSTTSSSKDTIASSLAVSTLSKKINKLDMLAMYESSNKGFEELDLLLAESAYVERTRDMIDGRDTNPGVTSLTLQLNVNDTLEFDYKQHVGAVLWLQETQTKGYPIVVHKELDLSKIHTAKHKALVAGTYQLSGMIEDSIKINGEFLPESAFGRGVIPRYSGGTTSQGYVAGKDPARGVSAPFAVNVGDIVRIEKVIKGGVPIFMPPRSNGYYLDAIAVPLTYPDDFIEWTATVTGNVTFNTYVDSKISIKKANTLANVLATSSITKSAGEIGVMGLTKREPVFATHMNYLLIMKMIDGVENIGISTDLGKTYTYIVNSIGKITNYHFFTDGTIMLSSEKKVYWTDDYVTINESVLLDEDGSPFVAAVDAHHFFGQQNSDKPMMVDGQEVYAWGDYVISGTIPSIWYTKDFGRTVKRATKMQGVTLDGIAMNIRHIHKVYFHQKQEKFYIMTGDFGDENMLMSGIYNPSLDAWTWEVIGRGHEYKFGNMWCDDYYAYFTADYTELEFQDYWGIIRVGLNHLGDKTKFRLAWNAKDGWRSGSPYRFISDRNGNKILIGELYAAGYIMVATKGYDFKRVNIVPSVVLSFIIGPNDNGDIYCKADFLGDGLGENRGQFLTGGTINLTKSLRNAGLTNFMRGEQSLPFLSGVSE